MNEQDAELEALLAGVESAETNLSSSTSNQVIDAVRHWWTTEDAMTMSAVVLAFGAIVIAIAAFSTRSNEMSTDSLLRLYGTIMVITMAAFLVVAGYNDTQIAAPLGLLGTIAGYLLGREGSDRPRRDPEKKEPNAD